jgi:hypothetical protein
LHAFQGPHQELDVVGADRVGTGSGVGDRLRIPLDPEHPPFAPDQAPGQERDVSST